MYHSSVNFCSLKVMLFSIEQKRSETEENGMVVCENNSRKKEMKVKEKCKLKIPTFGSFEHDLSYMYFGALINFII